MNTKEIDLVVELVRKGAAAVEKETNILWTIEDLLDAQSNREFQDEDQITRPSGKEAISNLFPGCLNMMGKSIDSNGEPMAQTSHFLIFGLPGGSK